MIATALVSIGLLTTAAPIDAGALDWGVKQSFRSYITGPIAHGSIELGGGATENADGSFRFPLTDGSYDDETGATVASFAGSVRFRGHDGQLDMTISDLRVELASDGSRVLADVASIPYPAGGEPNEYPDVELVALDLTGVEPTGTTTWAAIPAELTAAGAPAFGGFYTAGTPFDPVSFSYTGPGGKPIAEVWTEPGSPYFGSAGETTSLDGTYAVFVDPEHDLVHAVSATGVHAFDLETLEPRAEFENTELDQFGIAFDAETSTLFVRDATNNILTFRYDGGAYEFGEVPMPGARTLDYDPATDKLWAIGSSAPSPTFQGNPTVTVATRDGTGWAVETYPPIETNGRNIGSMARSSTGALIGSYGALLVSGQVERQASAVFEDTGDALVPTDIPDTVAGAPTGGIATGYGLPLAGADGSVLLTEMGAPAPETRILTIAPSAANASGYAVAGEPLRAGAGVRTVGVDRDDGSVYVVENDTIVIYRGGEPIATIEDDGVARVAGGQSALYAASDVLHVYRQLGTSPTVTQQPESTSVELAADAETEPVTFTAAASGTPAPTVRWQRRAPGATGWTDVDGATSTTLEVGATGALAGTRYRAVFENVAGALATEAATLAVTIVPPNVIVDPPPDTDAPVIDPPVVTPPTVLEPPLVKLPHKRVRVGSKRTVTLATVRCRSASCRVHAPKRVQLKIGRKTYRAAVLKPATLSAGQRGTVRLRLPRAAMKALAGRQTTVKFRLRVGYGEQTATTTVRVTLRRASTRARDRR